MQNRSSPREHLSGSRCVRCRTGRLSEGTTTMTVERDDVTVVFKGVPARVCDQCGEAYLDGATVDRVHDEFDAAYEAGTIVDVRRWRSEEARSELEHV